MLHGVSPGDLVKAAQQHSILLGNQFLLQFYQNPEDWVAKKSEMDITYASSIGIFNLEKIRPSALTAATYAELQSILKDWC